MHKNPDISVNSSKILQKPTIQDRRKKTRHPIGLVSTGKREVSRKVSSKPCKCGDVARGCPDMWV
jgi:hypothetical protein